MAQHAKNMLNAFACFGLGSWWQREDPAAMYCVAVCLVVGLCVGIGEVIIDAFSGARQEAI